MGQEDNHFLNIAKAEKGYVFLVRREEKTLCMMTLQSLISARSFGLSSQTHSLKDSEIVSRIHSGGDCRDQNSFHLSRLVMPLCIRSIAMPNTKTNML